MKTILTGTTQGLGTELAKKLAGPDLIVINRRPSNTENEILGDLSRTADVKDIREKLRAALEGQNEVTFILNAALYGEDNTISEVTAEAIGELMYANVFSQLTLVEALINQGIKVRLVALSSQMGSVSLAPEAYHYAYSASKAALNLCVRLLKSQYPDKLDYLLIHPGWMQTQMGGEGAPDDPVVVADNIVTAMGDAQNWNHPKGMLEVITGEIYPW